MRKLEIDPEFRDLLPALSEDEFKRLEESMIDYGGCHTPILVWGNTIIDGHNRWKILQKHPELTNYKIQQMNYIDRHEAIYWILQNQLGRRNLDGIAYDIAIAKAYEAQLKIRGGDRRSQKVQNGQKDHIEPVSKTTLAPTTAKVAADFNVAPEHVKKAVKLKRGLDSVERLDPNFENDYLSGKIKSPKFLISDLRLLSENNRRDVVGTIRNGDIKAAKRQVEIAKKTNKPSSLNTNVQKAIKSLESTEPDEMLTIKSEVPAMVDDFIRKFDRMYTLHKDAIQTAEGKAVMIENLAKVKKWIDERMKRYEE